MKWIAFLSSHIWQSLKTASSANYPAVKHSAFSIARALIGSPDLIILDEPSTGIDRQEPRRYLCPLAHTKSGTPYYHISVEHNLEMALANSTNIYHIANGQGHLCSPEQYACEIMHNTGCNSVTMKTVPALQMWRLRLMIQHLRRCAKGTSR